MTRVELFEQLATILEVEPGTLQGSDELAAMPGWDSLTTMNLIVVADRALGIRHSVQQFADCRTVQDIVDIFEKKPRL